jgi:hypothetical protein
LLVSIGLNPGDFAIAPYLSAALPTMFVTPCSFYRLLRASGLHKNPQTAELGGARSPRDAGIGVPFVAINCTWV